VKTGLAKAKNGLIAALDVGSSKICCFIARAEDGLRPRVIGIGQQASHGVKAGAVVDMEATEAAILHAVHAAEQMANETIDRVFVNLSGGYPESSSVAVEVSIAGHEVGDGDLRRAVEQTHALDGVGGQTPNGRHLIHAIPTAYSIDGNRGVRDPRGLCGERLALRMHFVTADAGAVRNLINCIARCHLDVAGLVVSPYAAGLASLAEDERELGVTVIDMGGGTTTIAVFLEGKVIYTDVVPIGGIHVTNDIARGLTTPVTHAERLKALYGHAIAVTADERETIDVPQIGEEDGDTQQVARAQLVNIVRPRIEETFELVRARLEASGFDKVAGRRVVLTGGASQLTGVRELATLVLDKQVRLGRPTGILGLAEATAGPAYATCAGILTYAAAAGSLPARRAQPETARPGDFLGRLSFWFREHF
jgi:cell division protein FtsA